MPSPVSNHFDSARALLRRGREQTVEAHRLFDTFFRGKPYTKVIDLDPQTGDQLHKFRLTSEIPAAARLVVKDAMSNLRDTLDHAVYGAAVAIRGGDPEDTAFPFADSEADLKGRLAGKKLTHVPGELHATFVALKPYTGGNGLLCGLNKARNASTHRILVPAGSVAMVNSATMHSAVVNGNLEFGYSRWNPAKNEVEFLRITPNNAFHYEVQVSFDVVFGDVEILAGRQVVGTLNAIASEVQKAVDSIESVTAQVVTSRGA